MLQAIWRLFRKPSRAEMAGEIVRLDLSTRVLHQLIWSKKAGGLGLRTVEQILRCTKEDLLTVKRFGPVAYNELQQHLYEHGFIPQPQYMETWRSVKARKREEYMKTRAVGVSRAQNRVDIVDVISGYVPLQKTGHNLKANCPFHSEDESSFIVFPEQQTWRCFGGCASGGDVISFLMQAENQNYEQARNSLAQIEEKNNSV